MKDIRSDLPSLVDNNFYSAIKVRGENAILGDPKNLNMKVHLTEIPANAMIFNCNKNRENVFNNNPQIHGICDYFMIVNHSLQLELFFFELKETQGPNSLNAASHQIKSSIPLLRYIVSGLQVHYKYGYQLPENVWQEHYVVLSERRYSEGKKSGTQTGNLQWWKDPIDNLPDACACAVNTGHLPLSTIRAESENAKNRAK